MERNSKNYYFIIRGENIFKRKDGRWEARYPKGYTENGAIKYGYCYGKTYREAKEKVALAKKNNILSITNVQSSKKRLSVFCEEWLLLSRNKVKESTLVKYTTNIEKHIIPRLGGFNIYAINSLVVENFSNELLYIDKLSSKTVRDILTQLKSILKYVSRNAPGFQVFDISYPKEEKSEMRVLTIEEQKAFTDYLVSDMDECKFGILLALSTGMRIGEICALRWKDISLDEKMIKVSNTMQRLKNLDKSSEHKTKVIVTSPKSYNSARIIPLTSFALRICETRAIQNPDAFILTGSSAQYIEPRTLQYRLKKCIEACGLEGVHFHTLRHTFATRCVEVDFEIKSLSEVLGHSIPRITLERYVHSSIELKRNNMDKLSAIGF